MSKEREIGDACIEEAAEILGVSFDEALLSFSEWMNETFTEMWESAKCDSFGLIDEDYNDYADTYVLAIRPSSGGGGGSGEEWVGMLLGFDRRFDMIKKKREIAIDVATADIGTAMSQGFMYSGKKVGIGRAHTFEGYWRCEHSTGMYVSKDKADTKPNWVVPINESISIAILKEGNIPQRASSWKSMWIFYGNTKENFLIDGPRLIALEGAFEAAQANWNLWQPITLRGSFDEKGYQDAGPTLTVSNANATYGLDWIPEGQDKLRANAESLFNPEQFLIHTTDDIAVNLKDLKEHHFENREESFVDRKGNQRYDGPLVCVVGGVMDINHEGRESQWDPTGRDYWLSISSQVLRRENPNARIGIQVSGTLHDTHHALEVLKNDEWLPYAKGSRIWIVGRSDDYTNKDGETVVKIDALGIYAVPHKSIPAKKPSNHSNDLNNLGGFGIGGDE